MVNWVSFILSFYFSSNLVAFNKSVLFTDIADCIAAIKIKHLLNHVHLILSFNIFMSIFWRKFSLFYEISEFLAHPIEFIVCHYYVIERWVILDYFILVNLPHHLQWVPKIREIFFTKCLRKKILFKSRLEAERKAQRRVKEESLVNCQYLYCHTSILCS